MRAAHPIFWILVGVAVPIAARMAWEAALGRPGRLVDCPRPVAPKRAEGHGPGSPAVRWPWPDTAFELGNELDRRN